MRKLILTAARTSIDLLVATLGSLAIVASAAVCVAAGRSKGHGKPRLLWGGVPIRTLALASAAMRSAGYRSETAVIDLYPTASSSTFDHLVFSKGERSPRINHIVDQFCAILFFCRAIHRHDIFHYFFDGGLLQRTLLKKWELPILKVAGKKIVMMPYGSDAFVYDQLPNLNWRAALLTAYADQGRHVARIERQVRHMSRYADCVVGCLVHIVSLPRFDALPLLWFPIDLDAITPRYPSADGPIKIVHATNHRGPKGTDFLIAAIDRLKGRGIDIDFELIEGKTNEEAVSIMSGADIVVDQLIFGYSLAALEAMALGKIVVSGIEPERDEYRVFSRYSYLDECPVVPASPETIERILEDLIGARAAWPAKGKAARGFAEKRHSYAACVELYEAVYDNCWYGKQRDLMALFLPVTHPD